MRVRKGPSPWLLAYADPGTAPEPLIPRAKRQTRPDMINDENENPFITRPTRSRTKTAKLLDLDELAEVTPIKASPAKHGRTVLSPTKIKTHFNLSKAGNGTLPALIQSHGANPL
jgi:hypothetical protein